MIHWPKTVLTERNVARTSLQWKQH